MFHFPFHWLQIIMFFKCSIRYTKGAFFLLARWLPSTRKRCYNVASDTRRVLYLRLRGGFHRQGRDVTTQHPIHEGFFLFASEVASIDTEEMLQRSIRYMKGSFFSLARWLPSTRKRCYNVASDTRRVLSFRLRGGFHRQGRDVTTQHPIHEGFFLFTCEVASIDREEMLQRSIRYTKDSFFSLARWLPSTGKRCYNVASDTRRVLSFCQRGGFHRHGRDVTTQHPIHEGFFIFACEVASIDREEMLQRSIRYTKGSFFSLARWLPSTRKRCYNVASDTRRVFSFHLRGGFHRQGRDVTTQHPIHEGCFLFACEVASIDREEMLRKLQCQHNQNC